MLGSISPYLLITPLALTPVLIFFAVKYHKASYIENSEYRSIDAELKESVRSATSSLDNEKFSFFKSINRKHTQERKKLSYLSNKYTMILNIIKVMIYIISCTVAGILAINGKMLIGEYLIFTAFINTIYTQILAFINYLISMKSAQPRIERVQQLTEVCLNEN